MKTAALIRIIRQAIDANDRLPLSEAEQSLYTKLHLAVMAYEDEERLGHAPTERRCMICEKPVSQCNC
jgi:hypothetical protein